MIQDNMKPEINDNGTTFSMKVGHLESDSYDTVEELMEEVEKGISLFDEMTFAPRATLKVTNGRYITTYG